MEVPSPPFACPSTPLHSFCLTFKRVVVLAFLDRMDAREFTQWTPVLCAWSGLGPTTSCGNSTSEETGCKTGHDLSACVSVPRAHAVDICFHWHCTLGRLIASMACLRVGASRPHQLLCAKSLSRRSSFMLMLMCIWAPRHIELLGEPNVLYTFDFFTPWKVSKIIIDSCPG